MLSNSVLIVLIEPPIKKAKNSCWGMSLTRFVIGTKYAFGETNGGPNPKTFSNLCGGVYCH